MLFLIRAASCMWGAFVPSVKRCPLDLMNSCLLNGTQLLLISLAAALVQSTTFATIYGNLQVVFCFDLSTIFFLSRIFDYCSYASIYFYLSPCDVFILWYMPFLGTYFEMGYIGHLILALVIVCKTHNCQKKYIYIKFLLLMFIFER